MEPVNRQLLRSARWSSAGIGSIERCRACWVRNLSHSRSAWATHPNEVLDEESSRATTPFAYRELRPTKLTGKNSAGPAVDDGQEGGFRFRASHFRPVVVPMLILSVLTSLAFNLAVARRERREQEELHVKRKAILQEATDLLSRTNVEMLQDQEQESRRLALRMIKLGLDPAHSGLDVRISDAAAEQLHASALFTSAREVRWSEAFFGKPGAVRSSITAAVSKAGQAFEGWKMGNEPDLMDGGGEEAWSEEEVQKAIERAFGSDKGTSTEARSAPSAASSAIAQSLEDTDRPLSKVEADTAPAATSPRASLVSMLAAEKAASRLAANDTSSASTTRETSEDPPQRRRSFVV